MHSSFNYLPFESNINIVNLFPVRDCLIENIESRQYGCANVPDDSDKVSHMFSADI
jgi:hypothetical protein